jgi:hypothetical protein
VEESMLRLSAAVALLVILAGCQDSGERSPAVTVRDSAGVEIIENAGDPWSVEERWHISPEPVLRIGAVEGGEPYLFDGVRGIVALSDGRIVVANQGDSSLRWFDAEGRFLFQRGGSGGGPGEFERLGGITVAAGDTIVAVDWSGRRFTLFGPDGGLGPTRTIMGTTALPGTIYQLPDHAWVVGTSGASTAQLGRDPAPGVHRLHSPILRVSNDGMRIDTIGVFPSSEAEITKMGDRMIFGPARFGRTLSYAVADDLILVGTADRLEVDLYSATGQHVRSVRAPEVDLRLTPEIESAYREFIRERMADAPPEQRAAERTIPEMELPQTVPAYSSLLVDDEANVWLGEYRYDYTPARRFLVFDRNGHFLTGVTVPPEFRALTIARDHVWGRATDDLGVEYVVGYAVQRE